MICASTSEIRFGIACVLDVVGDLNDQVDNSKDLDLQFAVKALKDEVEEGLQSHIQFATSCRKFDEDAAATREFLAGAAGATPSPSPDARTKSAAAPTVARLSTFSIFTSSSTSTNSTTASFPQPYVLSAADRAKWSLFLPEGESLVATSLVNKPNPVGKTMLRQILLTSKGKLLYVDVGDNSLKGTIDVSVGRSLWPIAKMVRIVHICIDLEQVDCVSCRRAIPRSSSEKPRVQRNTSSSTQFMVQSSGLTQLLHCPRSLNQASV